MRPDVIVEDSTKPNLQMGQRSQRFRGMTYPSDPQFDRTRFSSEEYIELLLSEIVELKSTISQLSMVSTNLKEVLIENSIAIPKQIESMSLALELRPKSPAVVDDIPQRSARRKLSHKEEHEEPLNDTLKVSQPLHNRDTSSDSAMYGDSTITFDGEVAVSDGVPLSKNMKKDLSAAAALANSESLSKLYDEEPASWKSGTENYSALEATSANNNKAGDQQQLRHPNSSEALQSSLLRKLSSNSAFSNNSRSLTRTTSASTVVSHRSTQQQDPNFPYNNQKDTPRESTTPSADRGYTPSNSVDQASVQSVTSNRKFEAGTKNLSPEDTRGPSKQTSLQPGSENIPVSRNGANDLRIPQTPDAFTTSFFSSSNKSSTKTDLLSRFSHESENAETSSIPSPSRSYFSGRNNSNLDIIKTPTAQVFGSTDSFQSPRKYVRTPGSSFQVSTPKPEDEVPLFIKPEEFYNIAIKVVSTIPTNSKKLDDPNCTFSITDKESGKEMWRVRKTYSQMVAFDNEIRPIVEFFGLPPLPEKALFSSTTPLKVDIRKMSLQEYFNTIFLMPHMPQIVLHRFCRYVSLDFVNPLDDFKSGARKEGYLIRRYKSLGTTWKIRWCQVDGPSLEIYDSPGGNLLEEIILSGSQIGRQSTESVAEERGYRHAFLILGKSKGSKLSSSTPKHFLCAESDEERDEWISAMVEFTDNDPFKHTQGAEESPVSEPMLRGVESLLIEGEIIEPQPFVTNLSPDDLNTKEQKDLRRMKKRSIFSFKHRAAADGSLAITPESQSQAHATASYADSSMQSYLNQMDLSEESTQLIFGRDLEVVYKLSNSLLDGHSVPSICYRCIGYLNRTGAIYEEGIFRLSGSASTIRQLKEKFNTSFDVDLFQSPLKPDMHTVAGLLKTFLRELPGSILGEKAYNEFQNYVAKNGATLLRSALAMMMQQYLRDRNNIDEIHYEFSYTIFKLLKSVVDQSSMNRMNLKNICIVFVPTLNISVEVLSICLTDFDCVFGNGTPLQDSEREYIDIQIPFY